MTPSPIDLILLIHCSNNAIKAETHRHTYIKINGTVKKIF